MAIWIETIEPGKPLGFLDANIRCGDSLLGLFDLEARALHALPEDSVEEIAEKRRRFEATQADPKSWSWRIAADLYVAAFLMPKIGGVPANRNTVTVPTTGQIWQALSGGQVYGQLVGRAQSLATEARAFHWPLEFPDVMASGGFDVVIGNPPWDVMQLGEEEYFAQRLPEIAELAGAARKRAIAALEKDNPAAFSSYQADKRQFEAGNRFARSSGRFDLTARGKINTYALFAELFANLARPHGRAGVIVPTGIATDATTAPFFAGMIEGRRLFSLHDFQTGLGYFDRIGHARFKFCLLTIGHAGSCPSAVDFSFFARTAEEFADRRRHFTLTREEISRINPNTFTAPIFRTSVDAELIAKVYASVPVLINDAAGPKGNSWGIDFRQGLFNMTSDSGLFCTAVHLRSAGFVRDETDWTMAEGLTPRQSALDLAGGRDASSLTLDGGLHRQPERYVPLYEAKMIHQFDHRWATYNGTDSRDVTLAEKIDSCFEPTPRYWVPEAEVAARLAAKGGTRNRLMGWRDITNATNERTVIFGLMPRVAVGHTAPLIFVDATPRHWAALLANLDSLTLDFVARQKVGGTHLTYGYLHQFPVLQPSFYAESDLAFIVPRVLELTYTSHAMTPFARDLGYEGKPFPATCALPCLASPAIRNTLPDLNFEAHVDYLVNGRLHHPHGDHCDDHGPVELT